MNITHVFPQFQYTAVDIALERERPSIAELIRSFVHHRVRRYQAVIQFRRAHETHRDARLVFRAAAEGRPLELQRRLVLGKLAGGSTMISWNCK